MVLLLSIVRLIFVERSILLDDLSSKTHSTSKKALLVVHVFAVLGLSEHRTPETFFQCRCTVLAPIFPSWLLWEIAPWDASLGSPIAIIHRVPVTTTLFEPLIALNDDVGDARTCPSPTNTCQRKMMGNNMSRTPHCNLSNLRSPTAGKYSCGFTLPIGHVNDFPRAKISQNNIVQKSPCVTQQDMPFGGADVKQTADDTA